MRSLFWYRVLVWGGIAAMALGLFALVSHQASARPGGTVSISRGGGYSRPYSPPPRYTPPVPAPRPVYVPPHRTYNRTTIIHSQRSGGGFWSNLGTSIMGAFAGNALYQWLFPPKAPEPQPSPPICAPGVTVPCVQPAPAVQQGISVPPTVPTNPVARGWAE